MKNHSSSIAITGANGFVARNLRKILNKKKIHTVCIARRNFQSYKYETKIISTEFSNKLFQKIKNCDTLIHLIGSGRQNIVFQCYETQ